MEWIFYRRLFRASYSEYKRYQLISGIEAIVIAALVAVLLCMTR